jgi:hypothetical protein
MKINKVQIVSIIFIIIGACLISDTVGIKTAIGIGMLAWALLPMTK